MPNIKPVSDLRNYNKVLRDIAVGEPVFLTRNGRGRYAIVAEDKYPENSAFQDFIHIHSTIIIEILSSYHQVKLTPKWIVSHISWCRIRIML